MNPEQRAAREAALERMRQAFQQLVDRVNLASEDGYDVLDPDVLAEALSDVANTHAAAGRIGLLEQCELFERESDAHRKTVDQRFPRPPA